MRQTNVTAIQCYYHLTELSAITFCSVRKKFYQLQTKYTESTKTGRPNQQVDSTSSTTTTKEVDSQHDI